MKRLTRIVLWLTAFALLFVILAEVSLIVSNHRTRQRAESLLRSFGRLKLGESALEDLRPILRSFNAQKSGYDSGCPSADAVYSIRISNDAIDYLGLHFPVLQAVGIRPWGVVALLTFTGGRLCSFLYEAGAVLPQNGPGTEIKITTFMEPDGTSSTQHPDYDIGYYTNLHGVRGLRVVVTPRATEQEIQRAFTYDFSCFTTFRGCQLFCQIAPLVSEDASRRHQSEELPVPVEEANDPRCAAADK